MRLTDNIQVQGDFLFRCRGLIPLLVLVPIAAALTSSGQFERWFGEAAEEAWDVYCVVLAFAGLAVRAATIGYAPAGTSGRNTEQQRAEALNTTGLYSIVRNPLYLGNCITYLAILLSVKVWWLPLAVVPLMILYYERIIMAEERFLDQKYGETYREWVKRTPAFFPKFSRWRPSPLPFSSRNVLRREYNGFYAIVLATTTLEVGTEIFGESMAFADVIRENPGWIAFVVAGTAIWVVLRTIKKRTNWLRVEGR
jgi:protein-S-isoprenylcysteine O-methyltransferase Ste14